MRSKLGASSTLSLPPLRALLLASALFSLLVAGPTHFAQSAASAEEPTPAPEPNNAGTDVTDSLPSEGEPQGWTAGDTSVSDLSEDEKTALCGLPTTVIDWEEAQAVEQQPLLSASYSYPSALDWRDYDGRNWTTPIRHQGDCGSCAAFATVGAIESRLEIALGKPGLNPDLSEAQLFYCGCGACCSQGMPPNQAMDYAADKGLADEGCFPYTAQNQACRLCQDWRTRVTKTDGWVGFTGTSDMKQALADGGPFQATMLVYEDFFDYSGGVYRHSHGALRGAHAVTIVGYSDSGRYWIAKNSWGTGWGENGWFKIAYGQCSIDSYAYVPIFEEAYRVNADSSPSQGGVVASDPPECTAGSCGPGTQVELTAASNEGYDFVGWSGDVSGSENPTSLVLDANKNVVANFVIRCDDCAAHAFVPLVVR
jgi:C1A family cysteine protease